MSEIGKVLLLAGVLFVLVGLILVLGGRHLGWMGKLPGDIRIQTGHWRFFFPLTTCIVISIVLTVVVSLLSLLSRR